MSTPQKNTSYIGFALAVIFIASTAATVIAPANFSGEWSLNESKSNFGDGNFGRFAAATFKIKQEKSDITINRNGTTQNGDAYSWEEKLTYDGKETETEVFNGAKRKASLKWSDDKKTFTINATTKFDRDGNTFEITAVEVWKLSDDGKAITIESNSTSQFGTSVRTLVYDKK